MTRSRVATSARSSRGIEHHDRILVLEIELGEDRHPAPADVLPRLSREPARSAWRHSTGHQFGEQFDHGVGIPDAAAGIVVEVDEDFFGVLPAMRSAQGRSRSRPYSSTRRNRRGGIAGTASLRSLLRVRSGPGRPTPAPPHSGRASRGPRAGPTRRRGTRGAGRIDEGSTSNRPASRSRSSLVGRSWKSTGPSRGPRPKARSQRRCTGSSGSTNRLTWVRYRLA